MATRVERFKHAEVQRQHRQRCKELGIPSRGDIGLAAVESWRLEMVRWQGLKIGRHPDGQIVNIEEERAGQLLRLFMRTVDILVERGFDKARSAHRFKQLTAAGDLSQSAYASGPAVGMDWDDPDEHDRDRITG